MVDAENSPLQTKYPKCKEKKKKNTQFFKIKMAKIPTLFQTKTN